MLTEDELFEKFLEFFPKFKPNVKKYYLRSEGLKIYTKQNKSFIFVYDPDNGQFELKSQ